MRPEPIQIALLWVEAANRADAGRLVALSTPDIEIVGPRGSVRGAAILRDWLRRAGLTLETKSGFAGGEAVVLEQSGVWRSTETGAVVGEAEVASRFVIAGERVALYQRFDDLSEALAAAGLQEADEVNTTAWRSQ